jgi:hypothetical protein
VKLTVDLHRALARQSYDALATEFVRHWEPEPPDKRRTARSFAAEIRKLATGKATWFQHRPKAANLLAKILGSSAAKLGLVYVPFEVQSRYPDHGWRRIAEYATLKAAEDAAWSLLIQHGGDWRVRHGDRTVAKGYGYRPGDPGQGHDRTAIWSRVRGDAHAKKRRRS